MKHLLLIVTFPWYPPLQETPVETESLSLLLPGHVSPRRPFPHLYIAYIDLQRRIQTAINKAFYLY